MLIYTNTNFHYSWRARGHLSALIDFLLLLMLETADNWLNRWSKLKSPSLLQSESGGKTIPPLPMVSSFTALLFLPSPPPFFHDEFRPMGKRKGLPSGRRCGWSREGRNFSSFIYVHFNGTRITIGSMDA